MADSAALFANLIPCDRYLSPFVDRHAQFGAVFEQGRGMGPCMMALRSTNLTCQHVDCLLNLWIDDDGTPCPVVAQEKTHLPWQVSERGRIVDAEATVMVSADHCYLGPRVLASRFRFANTGSKPRRLKLIYSGMTTGDRFGRSPKALRDFGLDGDHPLRVNSISCQPGLLEATLRDERFVLPSPTLHLRFSEGLRAACGDEPLWMGLASEPQVSCQEARGLYYQLSAEVELAPGEELVHQFTAELTVPTHACHEPQQHRVDAKTLDMDAAIAQARADFEARVAFDRPPATIASRSYKAWRARWALLRCGYQADGNGGEWGDAIGTTCVCSAAGFTRNFFWDALFSAAALADFNADQAKGSMRAVFSRMDERGFNPEHTYNYNVAGRSVLGQTQAPVASWAMEKYLAANPDDEAFLADFYPTMLRNHQHWLRCADRDGDGLMEWQWGGQTADDSPMYDQFTGGHTSWLGPQASVSLNAFLHRDAGSLATFADRLGKKGDAAWLRDEQAKRHDLFMDICYVPAEHRFWDYCHMTRRHVRAKTFYMCWPIWAGMDVPAATRTELIENVLLDPKQFFGTTPFPSTAYDEPEYDENQYWRGKAWPQISYWLLEMLDQEGYTEAAAEARKRLLGAWLRDPTFPENMRTDPHKFEAHHQPDYNWGIAFAYLLLTGR